MANDDVMTWFPRREDYEQAVTIVPDETLQEKVRSQPANAPPDVCRSYEWQVKRLNDSVESAQANVKEVVDGTKLSLEHKIYRTMDIAQDVDDFTALLRECEEADRKDGGGKEAEGIKKAKVGIMNLKAYLGQVDTEEFAAAIRNEFQFKVRHRLVLTKVANLPELPFSRWAARRASGPGCRGRRGGWPPGRRSPRTSPRRSSARRTPACSSRRSSRGTKPSRWCRLVVWPSIIEIINERVMHYGTWLWETKAKIANAQAVPIHTYCTYIVPK